MQVLQPGMVQLFQTVIQLIFTKCYVRIKCQLEIHPCQPLGRYLLGRLPRPKRQKEGQDIDLQSRLHDQSCISSTTYQLPQVALSLAEVEQSRYQAEVISLWQNK